MRAMLLILIQAELRIRSYRRQARRIWINSKGARLVPIHIKASAFLVKHIYLLVIAYYHPQCTIMNIFINNIDIVYQIIGCAGLCVHYMCHHLSNIRESTARNNIRVFFFLILAEDVSKFESFCFLDITHICFFYAVLIIESKKLTDYDCMSYDRQVGQYEGQQEKQRSRDRTGKRPRCLK